MDQWQTLLKMVMNQSVSIKGMGFLDQLIDYQLFREGCCMQLLIHLFCWKWPG